MSLKLLNFPHPAYLVTKAPHSLYNAASAATLTLTGSLPSVAFRCSVRLYTATGKTDCAGSVVVGSETLAFTAAGKKLTTVLLSALPIVTTSNLNCMIEIVAIDSGNAPIESETLTSIKIKYEYTTSGFWAAGKWTAYSGSYALTRSKLPVLNDVIRYAGIDHTVIKTEPLDWLNGKELYRILYF